MLQQAWSPGLAFMRSPWHRHRSRSRVWMGQGSFCMIRIRSPKFQKFQPLQILGVDTKQQPLGGSTAPMKLKQWRQLSSKMIGGIKEQKKSVWQRLQSPSSQSPQIQMTSTGADGVAKMNLCPLLEIGIGLSTLLWHRKRRSVLTTER